MKKLFALMVVFAALVAGCGEKTDTAPATPPADTEAAPADDAPADTTEDPAAP